MSKYKVGDLIEAEKKEIASSTRMRGIVTDIGDGILALKAQAYEPYVSYLEDRGFTITVLERAPELPTEPGWYLTGTKEAVYLAADGYWTVPHTFGVTGEDMSKYAPFTRLAPESETVEKIATWLEGDQSPLLNGNGILAKRIREKFGATK